jgi:hypothetical protein
MLVTCYKYLLIIRCHKVLNSIVNAPRVEVLIKNHSTPKEGKDKSAKRCFTQAPKDHKDENFL